MKQPIRSLEQLDRRRLESLVQAAAYGIVLVLGALTLTTASDIALGHGAELVVGVGFATWVAHFFAEALGAHVRRGESFDRHHFVEAAVDGLPVLAVTVLPAIVLLLGRLEAIDAHLARDAAIVVALAQLFLVAAFVSRVEPVRRGAWWVFASVILGGGILVAVLTTILKH